MGCDPADAFPTVSGAKMHGMQGRQAYRRCPSKVSTLPRAAASSASALRVASSDLVRREVSCGRRTRDTAQSRYHGGPYDKAIMTHSQRLAAPRVYNGAEIVQQRPCITIIYLAPGRRPSALRRTKSIAS